MNRIAQLASELAPLRDRLHTLRDQVIEEAITIQQIPGPTFDEARRARYVQSRFQGLEAVEVDELNNVYGLLPGLNRQLPAILVSAHTDTVFDVSAPLTIQREEGRIYGPGLGDNSMGVAGLITLAHILRDQQLPADIWFVANSREEGMGNLGGIRAAYQRLAPRLGSALVIEGMAYGRIYYGGIAVRRFEITCRTLGGHSWLHFGRPSAIHGLMRLGAQITTLQVPTSPRTTYNIGVIRGGQSVNSIATEASLLLDLRSEDRQTLIALEQEVMQMVEAQSGPDLHFQVEVVGDRPSGMIALSHPLVQMAREILELINTRPIYEIGSTDANVMLAAGLPTITVGVTQGGNAHRLDEYIDTANIADGLWQLALLIAGAAAGYAG